MWGYRWFSNTRKYRSRRTSTLDGWTSSGAKGSTLTRPDAIWARMSLSESSTQATYRFRYDNVAVVVRPVRYTAYAQLDGLGGSRGCSSMAERQLPKLIVEVRFHSHAPIYMDQPGLLYRPRLHVGL